MKSKFCVEGSETNELTIRKGKKKASIDERANIIARVLNTITGENKKESIEILIKTCENGDDHTIEENLHDLDKTAVEDALMKKVNETCVFERKWSA